MNTVNEILEQVNGIFKEVLENDNLSINYQTTADDIEEWDSFGHIQLVVAIEKYFKIRFTAQEITNFKNVGEMCDDISKKLSA
jgi:acyl carrier protein